MQRKIRVRQVLAVAGIGSLMLATSVVAGASSTAGVYNAADAKLVPSAYKSTTLQVATDASYAPDESMVGTTMVGFDIDLMKAVAKTLGIRINENNVRFAIIIGGIKGGRYDIGNSSFTDNKARQKTVNFVDYFKAGEGVYATTSSKVKFTGLRSFCGLKVAVETGTVEQQDATTAAKACSSTKKMTVLNFPDQTSANLAVLSGQADVGFVDSQIAGHIAATVKGFKVIGSAINVAPYGIATAKTTAGHGLAIAIKAALKTLIANGTYHSILAKYGVTSGGLTSSKIILNGATS